MTALPSGYTISLDRESMQPEAIHHWLSTASHWAKGIPFEIIRSAIANSAVAGVFFGGEQIGFARLITDYVVFAYLADVYIEEGHRGKGLSKALCVALLSQEWVLKLRRIMLSTTDAHGLYSQYGFTPLRYPERVMEILHQNPYMQ